MVLSFIMYALKRKEVSAEQQCCFQGITPECRYENMEEMKASFQTNLDKQNEIYLSVFKNLVNHCVFGQHSRCCSDDCERAKLFNNICRQYKDLAKEIVPYDSSGCFAAFRDTLYEYEEDQDLNKLLANVTSLIDSCYIQGFHKEAISIYDHLYLELQHLTNHLWGL